MNKIAKLLKVLEAGQTEGLTLFTVADNKQIQFVAFSSILSESSRVYVCAGKPANQYVVPELYADASLLPYLSRYIEERKTFQNPDRAPYYSTRILFALGNYSEGKLMYLRKEMIRQFRNYQLDRRPSYQFKMKPEFSFTEKLNTLFTKSYVAKAYQADMSLV
jgi:hypothetical protein